MEQGFGPEARSTRRGRAGARLLAVVATSGLVLLLGVVWLLVPRGDERAQGRDPVATFVDRGRTSDSSSASPAIADETKTNEGHEPSRVRDEPSPPDASGDHEMFDGQTPIVTRVPMAIWKIRTIARDGHRPVPLVDLSGEFRPELFHGFGGYFDRATSDADGCCSLLVNPRKRVRVHVVPSSADFQPCDVELEPLADHETKERVVELSAATSASSFVRVVARASGTAIAGATVATQLDARSKSLERAAPSTTTDGSGLAELALVVAPAQAVEVSAPGFEPRIVHVHRGMHERADRPQLVELDRLARLFGSVSDACARPIETADMLVTWEGNQRRGAELDEFGRFELDGLPPAVKLHVSGRVSDSRESVDVDVTLAPGEQRVLDLRVPDAASIRGRVLLPGGTPCDDASVTLIRPRPSDLVLKPIFVENDGTFATGEIWAGEWWVVARGRERSMTASAKVTADARSDRSLVELRLEPLATIAGHVVGLARFTGDSPSRASVQLDRPFDSPRSTNVGDDGSFSFSDVAAGPVDLELDLHGLAPRIVSSFSSAPRYDVELRVVPQTQTIVHVGECRADDPTTTSVTARRRGAEDDGSTIVAVHVEGSIARSAEFPRLAAGTWDFTATDGASRIATLNATIADDQGRTLAAQLEPGAWATIRVSSKPRASSSTSPSSSPPRAADRTSRVVHARFGAAVVASSPLDAEGLAELLVPARLVTFELLEGERVVATTERTFTAGTASEVELQRTE